MFEQFGSVLGLFVGNPNLVPEETVGWDIGVEYTLPGGTTSVDTTYFKANLQNEIAGFGNTLINLDGESTRIAEVDGAISASEWKQTDVGKMDVSAKSGSTRQRHALKKCETVQCTFSGFG